MSARSFTLDEAGQAHLEVFVYDMGSAANAYAVFSAQRRPGSPDIPLTAHAYATANALFFTQGRFMWRWWPTGARPRSRALAEGLCRGAGGQAAL
jgi:hypothetical protein